MEVTIIEAAIMEATIMEATMYLKLLRVLWYHYLSSLSADLA